MTNETVVKLVQPPSSSDPLTEVLVNGARDLLAQAVAAEVAEFLGTHAGRHGSLAEREVVIGIGLVIVPQPRVRNRGAATVALSVSASRR